MANRVRFLADVDDKVSGKLAKIRDNFDRVGKSKGFKSLAQGVGIGAGISAFSLLGSAAGAAVDFIGASVNAARDMSETLSKSRVVFGDAAAGIEQFGNTAAKSIGLAKRSTIDAAASFGALFTGLGESQGRAADMSKRLVTLGSDLTSFYNLASTEDALQKLKSGLAGEAEPLRALNVFLNEAKVKAKAAELGLGDFNGVLSEGDKVMARYELILEETTLAHGDYARTADGLANTQRRLTEEIKDSQAALGEQLQPAVLDATKAGLGLVTNLAGIADVLNGETTPASVEFAIAMGKLTPAQAAAAREAINAKDNFLQSSSAMANNKDAANQMTPAMLKAAEATDAFHKEAKTATERSNELRDAMLNTANALIDGFYDPIEKKAELAANNDEIRAANKIINSKNSKDAQIRDAKAVVTEAMHQNDLLTADLARTGSLTEKEFKAFINSIDKRIKEATGAEREYLRKLRADLLKMQNLKIYIDFVNRVRSEGIGAQVHKDGAASGGFRPAGWTGMVGEEGQERLTALPGGGIVVSPNTDGGSGGGNAGGESVVHTHVYLDGKQIAESVDKHLHRTFQRSAPTGLRS